MTRPGAALESFLDATLHIRPGEGRRTAILFAHLLLASAVFVLGRTVRDTLFLSRYPIKYLPWMFVLYGVASSITVVVYARYADRIARHKLIVGSTAIGMATHLAVMVAAVVMAVAVMLLASEGISAFVERHPTGEDVVVVRTKINHVVVRSCEFACGHGAWYGILQSRLGRAPHQVAKKLSEARRRHQPPIGLHAIL